MIKRKEGWLLFMVWNSLPDSILYHASCSGLRISRELSLRPFRTRPQLRLRGGSDQSLQEYGIERPKMQTYYDVDGTLYDGTMAHCGWWFLWALPDRAQRLSKALQFCFCLPYVGLLAAYDEGKAAKCLGNVVIRGVSTSDARSASEAVCEGVLRHAYPEVIQHLKTQQREGFDTILLSGNIEPMLAALASHLRCRVVATKMEEVDGVYTGNVVGQVCVLEGKRQRLLEAMHPAHRSRTATERTGLVGVGNSVYDVPFLDEVSRACVVQPSSRLRQIAERRGWDLTFAAVRGTGVTLGSADQSHKEHAGRFSKFARAARNSMELSLIFVYSITIMGLTTVWSSVELFVHRLRTRR